MTKSSARLAFALGLVMLTGCVGRGPYRTTYPVPGVPATSPPPNAQHEDTRVVEDHGRYQLAFVEFDESGKRQESAKQIQTAENLIRHARKLNEKTGKVEPGTVGGLTILYIHGWKNNA